MDDDHPDRDLTAWVERLIVDPPPYPGGSGNGIIIPAGGSYLVGAFVIVSVLRKMGVRLPVEIWHQGPNELTPLADHLSRLVDVRIVDVGRSGGPQDQGGWQLKAEALAMSDFRNVLLLDADNLLLVDPTLLFELREFREAGSIMWSSPRDQIDAANDIWKRVSMPGQDHAGIDSGQLLVDRERCWSAVSLCAFMNRHSNHFWRGIYGDKDTFLVSWLKTKTPFHFVSERPTVLDRQIILHDAPGLGTAFMHRFDAKWRTGLNKKFTSQTAERTALSVAASMATLV